MTESKNAMNQQTKMSKKITVNDWVAMFREIGLDDAKMEQWHRLFENRHAAAHQEFLEWLGLQPDEIARIRAKSK